MDDLYSVPDPTDWLSTSLPTFAGLETPLHCQICKEFYDTPMITSCNHTFCSRCIRTSLSQDGKCPACRTSDQASKLRNNWALQEVVAAFVAARGEAMGVAKQIKEGPRVGKRKRVEESSNNDQIRTTRSKSRRIANTSSQQDAIEIEDSEDEEEYNPESPEPPSDGLVECPLECGKRMKEAEVFAHLDRCDIEKQERQRKAKPAQARLNGFGISSSQPATRPQDRINQLNYSMLTDSAMAKKLKEGGIPSWGNKKLMTSRHREWVNIWNANCDSTQPRAKRDLLHDLDIWERTQGGKAPTSNSSLMRKDFDGDAHSKLHHDDFSRLIADARRKKNLPAPEPKQEEREQEEMEHKIQASQSDLDDRLLDLPIRKDDGGSPWTDDLSPSSQHEASIAEDNDGMQLQDAGISTDTVISSQEKALADSQQYARQNHALPSVTEQVLGR
ncbi:related to postreplication repair protein RAD18 [Ramularia collo-cygni]|uniref:Postreplication repair E3 ubiquitin-protein ligase RAD18 n=1 Tax=Ramularia collo-cygni TaxID=112498 RepID=A0A2D3V1R9_9PEZI|nr:related to postreplication repair protein RAD18 [Ramularia collo-cygni]CZT15449.1 related to postreplication repair protein RAD18 [Ramularia collo-cygni]